MSIPFWDFAGSTMVTNNYVRLTPDLQSKTGALWNSVVSSIDSDRGGSLMCFYF